MIRKVSVRGNRVTIDWGAKEEDIFFRTGLQMLIDDQSKGKRKVVVVPASDPVVKGLKCKKTQVSRAFVDMCIGRAVNQSIKDLIAKMEQEKLHLRIPKGKKQAKAGTFDDPLVHKIGEDGSVLCGVKRVVHASTGWETTTCPVCIEAKR
jgi:hypothetical protein